MSKLVYAWKPTKSFSVPAEVVGSIFEDIEARTGALRPTDVVDEARSKSSPLHPMFEWNDKTAAEAHRRHQARDIIAAVVVREVDGHEVRGTVNAFVNITDNDGQRYVSTVTAMADAEKRGIVLAKAKEELMRWRNKYDALQEFSKVFSVVDELIAA